MVPGVQSWTTEPLHLQTCELEKELLCLPHHHHAANMQRNIIKRITWAKVDFNHQCVSSLSLFRGNIQNIFFEGYVSLLNSTVGAVLDGCYRL